ncbi:MAG: DNA polymerase III subunit gamma/tau [Maricaulis sp.]|uniref:DNA polymerase III subunit gamma/tau n=1 Tax=Maricaulis sp. TaxID=1486257 RepID=UPI001B0C486A|nr:DNA polymerase III subunit gamma/tau [Maricaulis sp.]MBO6848815.1 DNA polymerase III subunit gamma/tau [Maricaulis sp.]MBO6878861.1 DNA polymerase III subunit gamma/tau [Maricaulis sp.]
MDDTLLQNDDAGAAEEALMPGLDLPEAGPDASYQVLARKYRPDTFEDLIGQEAMVRTLTNAFAAGRIAHAYMLTGVRGVGKTTTARLIARALNYATDEIDAPHMELKQRGVHCDAIARSAHVDVMEMDAASRTGVGDIREILEGVRYAPVSGRYKVYIIDEVHMLSTSAFNALLKTLEEPPSHAKFIFATTEIRKVPVTVLSRCQRFDLKRIDREVLTDHLERICGLESASVARDGLSLIARAAEGSVRDALSLLDQAIVQGGDQDAPVGAEDVRNMLGLADRARVLDLLEHALSGRTSDALAELASLYDAGGDPVVITRDLLDYVHSLSRVKAVGKSADLGEAAETIERLANLSERMTLGQLTRYWRILLTALDDIRQAPDALSAAEMTLLRLISAAMLPPPEDAARLLASTPPATVPPEAPGKPEARPAPPQPVARTVPPVAAPTPAPSTPDTGLANSNGPHDFEGLIALLQAKRDIGLQSDVERFVRPVAVQPCAFTFQPLEDAPPDLAQRLAKRLLEWTGDRWAVLADPAQQGGETWSERKKRLKQERVDAAHRDPAVVEAMDLFPGAELVKIRDPKPDESGEDAGQMQSTENRA